MSNCNCSNPQVCKEGPENCKYCAKRSVHCAECGRPIREEAKCCERCSGTIDLSCDFCACHKSPIREEKTVTQQQIEAIGALGAEMGRQMQEPSEGSEEIARVKRLYRGVINLDVEPNRYEFPNYEAADAALDKLLHSERTKIVGEIMEKMPELNPDDPFMWWQGTKEYRAAILKVLEDYKNSK